MDEKPTFRPYLLPILVLLIGGWGGLALLLNYSLPTLWPRWGFFALLVLALTGAALPVSYWVNSLFATPAADPRVVTRQSIWVGIYFAVLAWLQIGRFLTFSIGLWLALGLIALEYLLRLRETSARPAAKHESPQPPVD
jgi:hypothetical protein